MTSLIPSRRLRILGDPAAPEQFDEEVAGEPLRSRLKDMQAEYNGRVGQLGAAPQPGDFQDHASYASAFTDWAVRKQQLDAAFDQSRQAALDAHNAALMQTGRSAVMPSWKRAQQPLPEPEQPSVAQPSVAAQVRDFIGRMTRRRA